MFMKPSTSDKVENTQDLELRPDVNLGSVTHRPHTRRQYFNLSTPQFPPLLNSLNKTTDY